MHVIRTIADFRVARRTLTGTLGIVPTMGYLHEGHLALVRRARAENDHTAAWIFVNPTQFGPHEDFGRYPRDEARDTALLAAEGVDLLFMPPVGEIYPAGFTTSVDVGGVTERLEGEIRPGHFRGVTIVVTKFLNIMQPSRAYFGQKDGQQAVVIRKLVHDLNLPVEVVVCPTVREPDGLALSSRNVYLGEAEREAAPVLYRALQAAETLWAAGERDAGRLRDAMRAMLHTEPLVAADYISVADPDTLAECAGRVHAGALASLAARVGATRLIDNVVLG